MREKIKAAWARLRARLPEMKPRGGAGGFLSRRTPRENAIMAAALAVLLIAGIFFLGVKPRLDQLRNARAGLEKARSGYSYILHNASRVGPRKSAAVPDLGRKIPECVSAAARKNRLAGLNAVPDKKDPERVRVQSDEPVSYRDIINFVADLETGYGVTVDEITLDKQDDGMVYVSNMILVRLEKGEDND